MGLAERRRIAEIREKHGPRFQSELNEAVGFELPFEIEIASFPENKTVLDCYDFNYESYGPGMVVQVFKNICYDDMGKDAVKAAIKKILFRNTAKDPENPGDKSFSLVDGLLTIESSFYGYSDKLFYAADLQQSLEALL